MADNPYERDIPEPTSPAPAEDDAARADARTAPTPDTAVEPAEGAAPDAATARHDDLGHPGRPADDAHDTDDADGTVTSTFDVRQAGTDRPTGSHEAERTVPRAGLAEHRSAGYLTGEQSAEREPEPADSDDGSTTRADGHAPWLAGGTAAAAHHADDDDRSERAERDVVLDGATARTRPPSRTRAHVLAVALSLLLTPVAWYLLADAGARLTLPQGNPWDTGNLNVAALLELAGGLVLLAVVLLAARWSSVGAIVTGVLVLVVGVPFVAVPAWTQDVLEPVVSWFARLGEFGDNVTHHLVASGSTGRLVISGVALVLVGVVSHGARRQGRREVHPGVDA